MMPDEGWVPIANSTAQSRRLSWRAKGLLADLLSFPDGYDITFDRLIAMAKAAGDPDVEGRDAMRRAMQELERKGYVAHVRYAMKDEGTDRVFWRTETIVCDLPGIVNVRTTGIQEPGGAGGRPSSTTEGQELSNNTVTYKNGDQDELAKSSTALAAARAGEVARENELPPELADLYESARKLDDDRLRRLLLQFEDRRPTKYRDARRLALLQLKKENPRATKTAHSVRSVDELSFMYGLRHYYNVERPAVGIPTWLRRFPQ